MNIQRLIYEIRQDQSNVNTNSHEQAAKRSIYYIRKYVSRNIISEIFQFRSPYCLTLNDGSFNRYSALVNIYNRVITFGNKYDFMYIQHLIYDIRQDQPNEKTNPKKPAAKRSIYYIRKHFLRNLISEIFELRSPYRLAINDGFF